MHGEFIISFMIMVLNWGLHFEGRLCLQRDRRSGLFKLTFFKKRPQSGGNFKGGSYMIQKRSFYNLSSIGRAINEKLQISKIFGLNILYG